VNLTWIVQWLRLAIYRLRPGNGSDMRCPPKRRFIQDLYGVTSQKTAFFNELERFEINLSWPNGDTIPAFALMGQGKPQKHQTGQPASRPRLELKFYRYIKFLDLEILSSISFINWTLTDIKNSFWNCYMTAFPNVWIFVDITKFPSCNLSSTFISANSFKIPNRRASYKSNLDNTNRGHEFDKVH
jgi:hypothetical protein